LRDAYKDAFLIGCAVNEAVVTGADQTAQDIVLQQFNSITPENVMKAGPINPQPGIYNFSPADRFVEFGEKNQMFIIGHTLIWHNQTPDWFFNDEKGNPNTHEAQIERMRSHIKAVAGRYAGRVNAWDVVNEVIDNDGSYRPTKWVNSIGSGDELVKLAFKFARIMLLILSYITMTLMRGGLLRETVLYGLLKCCKRKVFELMELVFKVIGDLIIQKQNISKLQLMHMLH
jgi:endo-1,4-beta-xylanase